MSTLSDPISSESSVKHWSTMVVPAACRLDYFAAALSEAVLPMAVDVADPEAFDAELRFAKLGEIGVARGRGVAHVAHRGKLELVRSDAHTFNLLMSPDASWSAEHRGAMRLCPCDILVIDSAYPFKIETSGAFEAVNVSVTEAWLRRWVPDPGALASRRISGDSLWGQALAAYLGALSPELVAAPPLPLSVLADQVGALLALTATGSQSRSFAGGVPERSVRDRVRDCIRQRCTEPGLTVSNVAATLGVSPRTLHRALAACHESFGGLLIDARVDVGVRMLRAPIFRRMTIERIGLRAGFVSASHFAQVVRARTGSTPGQLRRGGL